VPENEPNEELWDDVKEKFLTDYERENPAYKEAAKERKMNELKE
jgi:hypothetical protein